jgi:hypothetical protein
MVGKRPEESPRMKQKTYRKRETSLKEHVFQTTSDMTTTIVKDEEKSGPHTVERVATSNDYVNHGYEPETPEACALDKRVNLKLDFVVVLVLAIDFILCGIDKTNIGYVATTSES